MAGKYYVVKSGRKTGIFNTWAECKALVDGFSGAVYKSFKTKKEAENYFYGVDNTEIFNCKEDSIGTDTVCAYVDGSFYEGEFSYGMVIIRDGMEFSFAEKINDKELAQMHNVAGEIKGAQAAMRYAVKEGLDSIVIYHDYEGIAKWCLGDWKANKEGTKAYKAFYDSIKDKVKVDFVKVKGHSGDKYNEMADRLAKKALGILDI